MGFHPCIEVFPRVPHEARTDLDVSRPLPPGAQVRQRTRSKPEYSRSLSVLKIRHDYLCPLFFIQRSYRHAEWSSTGIRRPGKRALPAPSPKYSELNGEIYVSCAPSVETPILSLETLNRVPDHALEKFNGFGICATVAEIRAANANASILGLQQSASAWLEPRMATVLKINLNDHEQAQFEHVLNVMAARLPDGLLVRPGTLARKAFLRGLEVMAKEAGSELPGPAEAPRGKERHANPDDVVRLVHRLYHKERMTKSQIIAKLVSEGYQTARGGVWRVATINRLLARTPKG